MPTASHLRNLKQALGSCRRALEEFESALLELEETPDENGEAPKRSPNVHNLRLLYNRRRSDPAAREKVCEVCGEALRDTRRDAKTCSAACRQKAYRRRVHHLPPYRAGAKSSRAILHAQAVRKAPVL